MNFEEHMRNWSGYNNAQIYLDPITAKLVADLIAAAREVHECHCDPYPVCDDVIAERAGIDRLGLAIKALDAHYEKGKA